MLVIGIDSHKDSGGLPHRRGGAPARASQHRQHGVGAPRAGQLGPGRLCGARGHRGLRRLRASRSARFGRAEVVDVPPQMTAAARRSQRTAAKSDPLDALLVARIGARDSDLPPPRPGGTLEELRCLAGYRRELVKSRTAHINRLHADLTQIRCGYHRTGAALTSAKGLQRVARLLAGDSAAPARVARGRLRQIRELNRQIADLAAEISELVSANGTTLTKRHRHHRSRRHPHRSRRPRTLRHQGPLRDGQRHRTPPSLIGAHRPPPTEPRRQPPTQPRHPHRRPHSDRPTQQRRQTPLPTTPRPRQASEKPSAPSSDASQTASGHTSKPTYETQVPPSP